MEFSLQGKEFIELNKLLKFLNLADSGGISNQMISEGCVLRNKEVETRKRCKLKVGDVISIKDENIQIIIVV
ncbi:MAG: RNA-binding S4 domain-containing protein [Flavobacteriales bacterium]